MIDQPIRLPWIGPLYRENRVLIMGESHHCDMGDEYSIDLTTHAVQEAINRTLPSSFFDKVKDAVLGATSADTPAGQFWGQFAFANFCQGPVVRHAGEPLQQASPDMFRAGELALPVILALLKPRKLLLFSKRAWTKYTNDIPAVSRHGPGVTMMCPDGKKTDTYFYASDALSFSVNCLAIHHPSCWTRQGKKSDYWSPVIQSFLDIDPVQSLI
ncbi:hypothetical protein [Gluconacetobacter tumulicola]|uniref:Uracil-DNA glycosylase n=1 Tax=Gluconacetobacter tumulicola TaxID=1017177 RepID=A0A7W4JED5_9PROT|nr:hypothetical protein [Gluconacetobacter tumulicola]MBB2179746.1 hypothetical protein [Gluconacetobacter tumulicola]